MSFSNPHDYKLRCTGVREKVRNAAGDKKKRKDSKVSTRYVINVF